jgi:hypothetical protein
MHRHVEVYLDESGDMGFSKGGSEHFIAAALVVRHDDRLVRLERRCRRKFSSSLKGNPEIKFNRSSESVRRFILEGVSRIDSMAVWSGITKSSVSLSRRQDKDTLWTQVAVDAVSEVSRRLHVGSMHIVIDRRHIKKVARKAVDDAIEEAVSKHHAGIFAPSVRTSHLDSSSSPGLRIVDHIAGAVFQSVERGDHTYLRLIEAKISHGGIRQA